MTRYRAVLAADMDFTLLLPGQDIPPENVRAVKRLQDNGIAFTIATGRSSFLVGKFAERLGIDIPLITGNGGALFDPVSRKDIMSMDFPDSKVRELIKLMAENEVNSTLYSVTGIYFMRCSKRRFFCEDYNRDVEPAKQAPRLMARASPVFAGEPAPTGCVVSFGWTLYLWERASPRSRHRE